MAVLPQQLGGLAEAKMRALLGMDSGAVQLLSAAVGTNGYQYQQYINNNCAGGVVSGGGAQSELTCNGGVAFPSRKRGREGMAPEQYVSSSSALLPVPGMQVKQQAADPSTSGRQAAETTWATAALASELLCRQQGAELDALVRAECDRMRAGLEQARKRQRQALVSAVVGAAERRLREKDAELCAARRRAVELEERLRQAAAESQAWCGVARANEAVAAGLRATVDHLLLRGGSGVAGDAAEGCGESDDPEDAQSCCFVAKDINNVATATSSPAEKWACKACGAGDATVLLLPCRHLCLCKACEPKMDACPVCLAVKKTSIHVADNN